MPQRELNGERTRSAAMRSEDEAARVGLDRFRVLADSYPGALVIYDAERRFLFLNSRVVEWSDRPLADWIGRRDEDVFPPDVTGAYLPVLRQAIATGAPQSAECTIRLCGETVYLAVHYVPSLDDAGNVREVLGVARDVTQQRRTEQELLRRDAELRSLADNVPDIIARLDRDGRHLFINRQIEAVTGIAAEEFLGKTNAELGMPADLVAQWEEACHLALDTAMSVESQFLWPSPDGNRHFEVRLLPECGPDGRAQTVLAITRDITDRQHVLSQLSDSEQRFRMAFEAAPIGIALVARDGTLLEVNHALCEMLGYPEDELTGLELADITHPDDLAHSMAHAEAAFAGAGTTTLDKRHLTKDGRYVWGRVTSTILRDAQGGAVYSIRMIQDINESRRTRQELERYQEHLEELVRSRTRALEASQESLRSAERLASLGTLAAGIAHEINNPVGTILLAAEMALAADASGDCAALTRCLEAIKNDAQRCGRIVKNVLSFARQKPTDKSPYPLNEIVRQAIERTKEYADRRQARLTVALHDGVGRVLMNPVAIELSLVNIIRNAIESRPENVSIHVATAAVKDAYTITVADDGPGMSADVQRHIFDPFFTMRRANGGTGLGLSLVHGTINDHRGSIHVESLLDEGTTFLIEFPRYEGPQTVLHAPHADAAR